MPFDSSNIWASPQLPALPAVGTKVLEHSRQPGTALRELEAILRADPKLAGDLIRIANSPLGMLSAPVQSIEQALLALGVTNAISLTLSRFIVDVYQGEISAPSALSHGESDLRSSHSNRFWSRAIAKAVAAEMLCQHVRDGLECEYFLAGLTLDLGAYVLLQTSPREFLSVEHQSRQAKLPRWELEKAVFGETAAEIGGQLLAKWGFAPRLVRGVKMQHATTEKFHEGERNSECSLSRALALASAIGDFLCDEQQAISLFRIRELTRDVLQIRDAELDTLMQTVVTRFNLLAPVFASPAMNSTGRLLANVQDLKIRAIEQLTSLGGRLTDIELRGGREKIEPHAGVDRRESRTDGPHNAPRSNRDPLTQVYHHEFLKLMLEKEVQRSCQYAAPLGIAIVEVDRIETFQQKFGPEFTDLALQRIAGIVSELLRSSDTLGRLDQEFLILASNPTAKGMQKLADRVRGRVDGERLEWKGHSVPLTVSVGSCLALPGRTDLDIGRRMIDAARKATQEAKFGEGNNSYFTSLVDEVELHRLFMANQMRFSRWLISQGVLDIPRVAKALLNFQQRSVRMGDLAIRQELLSKSEVQQVLADQEATNARFGEIAVRRTYLTEEQLNGLLILQQEDPILVASLFMKQSLLEPQRLQKLLKDYFAEVPWAAPLHPTAGRG